MNLNFHDKLAYIALASDENELMNRVLNKPIDSLILIEKTTAENVEKKIQNFLQKNEGKLGRQDAPSLKRLQHLVKMLEVRIHSENSDQSSTLDKTIATCI